MVILVDDEEDRDGEREQVLREPRTASQWASSYTAESLPWDDTRQRPNLNGSSTAVRSEATEPQNSDEVGRLRTRRPMFRQPSEMSDPAQQPFTMGSRPKVGGRTFSVSSNRDERISVDEEKETSTGGADNRPTSQGSTFVPLQNTMQPKVKIAGRPSLDADSARKAPINMPGRSGAERETSVDSRPSARRTYKSLSPYGILFED